MSVKYNTSCGYHQMTQNYSSVAVLRCTAPVVANLAFVISVNLCTHLSAKTQSTTFLVRVDASDVEVGAPLSQHLSQEETIHVSHLSSCDLQRQIMTLATRSLHGKCDVTGWRALRNFSWSGCTTIWNTRLNRFFTRFNLTFFFYQSEGCITD